MALIGLTNTNFTPGVFLQVNFDAGASGGTDGEIAVLLMGAKLADAPGLEDGYVYGPDVEGLTVRSEADVVSTFGAGSELHGGYREFVKINSVTPVYFLAVKESTGAAATGVATFATTATGNGYVRVYFEDEFVDTPVSTGDTATVIGANVRDSVNSKRNWACVAGAATGALTITCKNKGPRGNKLRFAVKVVGAIATTSTAQNFANLSGGSTSDSWTNALATINPKKFRYIVAAGSDASPSGDIGLLVAQVATQALPLNDIRQRVVVGNKDSIGTVNTFAKTLNANRSEVVWQPNSNLSPFRLACHAAGAYCLGESSSIPRCVWDYLGTTDESRPFWKVAAPFDGSAPSPADITSALVSGVSPVKTLSNGVSTLVSRITSYSQDSDGHLDTRSRDACVVTIMDLAADRVQSALRQSFSNKLIGDNPKKGARAPGRNVVTPNQVKAVVGKVLSQLDQDDLLDNAAASIASLNVQRDASVTSRMNVSADLTPKVPCHQIAVELNQTVA